MTPPTQFVYALYDEQASIGPESPVWGNALPVKKNALKRTESRRHGSEGFTYGDYFIAARAFLEQSAFLFPNRCDTGRSKPAQSPDDVEQIVICLKKHGELYHPARIEVTRSGQQNAYALNLAVSPTGNKWARRECRIMEELGTVYAPAYIPRVYDAGASTGGSGKAVFMFLGDWFDGYHEFHLSVRSSSDPLTIRLWDAQRRPNVLSSKQTLALYRAIARVLLYYYDVETTRQIFPWHHAAGDFVTRVQGDRVGVKLITTRGYPPLISDFNHHKEAHRVLDAMLVFMLSVSIRMRLDRLDGVGDMMWAGDIAVTGVVDGFFKGMEKKPAPRFFPAPLADCFEAYLAGYQKSDLYELLQSITDRYPLNTPEFRLAKTNLKSHAEALFQAVALRL